MSGELSHGDKAGFLAQILVVDDDPFILEFLGAILSGHNFVPILEFSFEDVSEMEMVSYQFSGQIKSAKQLE